MTEYGKPRQQTDTRPDWIKKKEARQKVLAGVRARRKALYKKFFAKAKQNI